MDSVPPLFLYIYNLIYSTMLYNALHIEMTGISELSGKCVPFVCEDSYFNNNI